MLILFGMCFAALYAILSSGSSFQPGVIFIILMIAISAADICRELRKIADRMDK